MSRKKLSRREAISKGAALGVLGAGIVGGIVGYYAGSQTVTGAVQTVRETFTTTVRETITASVAALVKYQNALNRYGGTINVVQEGEPTRLDPHVSTVFVEWWIENHIYEGLLRLNPYLEIEPGLAWYWEQPDTKTIIFYLRKNVKFHNGRLMTSADVKYSFERVMDPNTGSPTKSYLDVISSIETPDDYTVRLKLSKPSAVLLPKLAEAYGLRVAIVPKEAVDELATKPIGTGPFKFKEWVKGDHITLERFDDYWETGFPYVDKINFYFQGDPDAMYTMLKSGTVDFAEPIYYKYAKEVVTKDVNCVINKIGGFHWILMNAVADSPFKDKRVRQAVAHAINRQELIDLVFFGYAAPIDHPLLPGTPWYVTSPALPYDPDKAKQLLADAGYPNGFDDEIVGAPTPEERKIAEVVAAQLQRVGIRLRIKTPEIGAYIDEVINKRTYHIADCGWTPPPEPDIILSAFFQTNGMINWTGFSDPDIDNLFERGREELDVSKRKLIYQQILNKVLPEAHVVFLEQTTRVQAWWRHLHGYVPRPDLSKLFHEVWTEKK